MDEVPTEVLRRIPALLNTQDVGRLMRAGSRRIFDVCGEHLYSTIQLSMAHPHAQPHNPAAATRIHGRPMLEVLSAETPRGSLEPPARWVRHLAVAWPLFPTGEEAEYCTLLLRALSCTDNILSLEVRGRSPLAWRHGLHTPAQSSHFLPRLVALKTDDVGDSIELSNTRTLEAIFVTTLLTSQNFAALLASIRLHPAALSQVQLSLEITSIQDTLDAFEKIVSALPNLRVLCLEFDLGIDFPERPLAWTTVHNTLSRMGQALERLQRLHTISVTIFPEPLMVPQENVKAIQLLSAHCDTLRRVEVRWCRRDEEGYHYVATRQGLIRGQWAYRTVFS